MLIGERVTTRIEDGEFAGAEAIVDRIVGEPIYRISIDRMATFLGAEGSARNRALRDLYAWYLDEARPSWNLEDPRGPVPTEMGGLLRLPLLLVLKLCELWIDTFPRPETTVADETLPPGPVRDAVNEGLRRKR